MIRPPQADFLIECSRRRSRHIIQEMTEVWVRRCADFDEEQRADREFWARTTPTERITALEELRAQWKSAMSDDGHEGLRRTVRVLQRETR